MVLWASVQAYGGDLSLVQLILINCVASLVGGAVPVPGGMGVIEAGLIAGMTAAGLPQDVAAAATFTDRLFTAYLPPIWGWFALAWCAAIITCDPSEPAGPSCGSMTGVRHQWLSRRAIAAHVAVLVVVPFCLLAGWWQLDRARSGNTISWAYVIEWPIFAVVATVMWWQLVHDKRAAARERGDGDAAITPATHNVIPARLRDQEDPALQAYNDRLELLASFERRKTWRHPKGRP